MRRAAVLAASTLLLAGLAGACDDTTGPETERVYFDSQVFPGPVNVLSAEVEVRAVGFDSVALRYGRAGEAQRRTPAYAFGTDSLAYPALLGLAANSFYDIEVVLLVGSNESIADTIQASTGTLPEWIPAVTPVGTDTTPGFLILSIPEGPVIVDNAGTVVWYMADLDPILVNFQAHPGGSYTIFGLEDETRFYRVLDELGREVRSITCVGNDTRFHEIRVQADGSALVLCNDLRPADLSPWGGAADGTVDWTVIQHVGLDGSLDWEWHSADHFAIGDTPLDDLVGVTSLNLTHGNALELDADGNLLASFRELAEITKINIESGEVMWRFGGRRNQFAFLDDAKGSFERQHGLRLVEPGVVQFLDNSNAAPSRLVRYAIDEQLFTARLVWDFIDAADTWTTVGGSTQVYADGGGLVSFGRAGRVVEVDESGAKRWELTGIDGAYVFRAQRMPSLYAAERTATQ